MTENKEKSRVAGWLLGAGLAAVVLGALWVSREIRRGPESVAGWQQAMETTATVLPDPMTVPAFELVDQRGSAFGPDTLRGQWTYFFFGYTYCPDVCPTTLSVLAQANKLIQREKNLPQPRFVFVSVDPQRDGEPARLAEYMAYFDPKFVGVTGSAEALRSFTKSMGIHFQHQPSATGDDNYLVDHSAAILLFDPQGRLRALTSPPHSAAAISSDYGKIVALD